MMEFEKEKVLKHKRQSKMYENEDWSGERDCQKPVGGFFSHSLAQIDNTTVYRVLFQNPNGIDPSPSNHHFQLSLNTCFDHCVAFISLTETNIEWRNHTNRDNLRTSLKKWWDGSSFQTSTSSIPFVGKYKPGGTASIVCGNHWVARIIEKGDDEAEMGRFSFIGLQGNQTTKLLHITWYVSSLQAIERNSRP